MKKVPTIVCVDDRSPLLSLQSLQTLLQNAGHAVHFEFFPHSDDFESWLENVATADLPTSYLLDSTPYRMGLSSAEAILDRFARDCPEGPQPLLCITSAMPDCSLQLAEDILGRFPHANVHLADVLPDMETNLELWKNLLASPPEPVSEFLPTYGLREMINRELGLNVSLEITPSSFGREVERIRDRVSVSNLGRDFEILRQGDLSSLSLSEIVARDQHRKFENFSSFAAAIETPLLDLDRRVRAGAEETLLPPSLFLPDGTEVSFSGAVGRPVQGPVVFSLDDVKTSPSPPVLVMNKWPAYGTLFPYFNQLAGVVILSQKLADHTEAVLSNYRLSGVFGLSADTGHGAFIEAPVIDLPDGKQMAKGDFVALRTREINPESTETSLSAEDSNALRYITEAYLDYLLANSRNTNIPVFKVNASAAPEDASFPKQIGLFRTEELASASPEQMQIITKIMQGQATEGDFSYLEKLLYADYTKLLHAVDPHHGSPRIRLFDFRVQDHFAPEEWRKAQYFVTRGEDALETYPDLYRTQLHALLSALHEYRCYSFSSQKMEIMMPSLQSKAGVETFLSMVKEKAEEAYFTRGKDYDVGIMAENLRLCQVIGEVAGKVDFISIGSNDLTTDVLQIERKDTAGRTAYRAKNGFDPFISPDPEVFGEVIPALVAQAQEANPDIVIDICGRPCLSIACCSDSFRNGGERLFSQSIG